MTLSILPSGVSQDHGTGGSYGMSFSGNRIFSRFDPQFPENFIPEDAPQKMVCSDQHSRTGCRSGLLHPDPAFFLSSLVPARTVKGSSRIQGGGALLRRILVVVQFTLSLLLIIGTLTVNSQIAFIMNKDLGMDKENIIYHLMQYKTRDSISAAREELLRHPDILSIASCSHLPSNVISWIGYLDWEGRTSEQQVFPAFLSWGL